jgi:hypothetical protein
MTTGVVAAQGKLCFGAPFQQLEPFLEVARVRVGVNHADPATEGRKPMVRDVQLGLIEGGDPAGARRLEDSKETLMGTIEVAGDDLWGLYQSGKSFNFVKGQHF